MFDCFALLDQSRRPWLESGPLKDAFHRSAAVRHPDVAGTGDAGAFAAINEAYLTLKDPAKRIRHLLELEAPETLARSRPIPAGLSDLFMAVAGGHQQLTIFLARASTATTPLAQALLAGEKNAMVRQWGEIQVRLGTASQAAVDQIRDLDSAWNAPAALEQLAELSQQLSYLSRWQASAEEAVLALTF